MGTAENAHISITWANILNICVCRCRPVAASVWLLTQFLGLTSAALSLHPVAQGAQVRFGVWYLVSSIWYLVSWLNVDGSLHGSSGTKSSGKIWYPVSSIWYLGSMATALSLPLLAQRAQGRSGISGSLEWDDSGISLIWAGLVSIYISLN